MIFILRVPALMYRVFFFYWFIDVLFHYSKILMAHYPPLEPCNYISHDYIPNLSSLNGHIPKLFFRDADDFDSKTPSSIEGVKKLVNVVLW